MSEQSCPKCESNMDFNIGYRCHSCKLEFSSARSIGLWTFEHSKNQLLTEAATLLLQAHFLIRDMEEQSANATYHHIDEWLKRYNEVKQ